MPRPVFPLISHRPAHHMRPLFFHPVNRVLIIPVPFKPIMGKIGHARQLRDCPIPSGKQNAKQKLSRMSALAFAREISAPATTGLLALLWVVNPLHARKLPSWGKKRVAQKMPLKKSAQKYAIVSAVPRSLALPTISSIKECTTGALAFPKTCNVNCKCSSYPGFIHNLYQQRL